MYLERSILKTVDGKLAVCESDDLVVRFHSGTLWATSLSQYPRGWGAFCIQPHHFRRAWSAWNPKELEEYLLQTRKNICIAPEVG